MFPDLCESQYERERQARIAENKKVFLQLFPNGTSLPKSPKPKSPKQQATTRRRTIAFPVRRNPTRKARCYDSDFCTGDDEEKDIVKFDDSPRPTLVKIRGPLTEHLFRRKTAADILDSSSRELDSDEDSESPKRSRKSLKKNRRAVPKPWIEVTEEDLILVAERVADKRYDSEKGTSCHQCRQKTDDLKTMCKSDACVGIRGQFCGPCLKNRYGENAKEAIMDPDWVCPPCRGICNCSFCMKKRGKRCTGIMIHVAKKNGFEDVKSFLGD